MFYFRFQAHLISTGSLTALALCLAMLSTGCQKKPAHDVPTVLVPSIETQPQPAPPQNPPNEKIAATPETVPASTPPRDEQKPRPKPRNTRPVTRKPSQPAPPITEAPKPESAKPEPAKPAAPDNSVQITADVPRAAIQSQKQNTENLLPTPRESSAKSAATSATANKECCARRATISLSPTRR